MSKRFDAPVYRKGQQPLKETAMVVVFVVMALIGSACSSSSQEPTASSQDPAAVKEALSHIPEDQQGSLEILTAVFWDIVEDGGNPAETYRAMFVAATGVNPTLSTAEFYTFSINAAADLLPTMDTCDGAAAVVTEYSGDEEVDRAVNFALGTFATDAQYNVWVGCGMVPPGLR